MSNLPGCRGERTIPIPGDITLRLQWMCADAGLSVNGSVRAQNEKGTYVEVPFALHASSHPETSIPFPDFGISVGVRLQQTGDQIELAVQPPNNGWIPLAIWHIGVSPEPSVCCEPDRPGTNGTIIENVHRELFSFMCLRPADAYQLDSIPPGFVISKDPQDFPLYQTLKQLQTEPDAVAKMREAAAAFIKGENFVTDLSDLQAPMNRLPEIGFQLLALTGHISLPALNEEIEKPAWLGMTLDAFFASDAYRDGQPKTWQSLFALALAGTYPQASLADQLTAIIRVLGFFEHLRAEQSLLETQDGRLTVLSALPAYPNAVAPGPLPERLAKTVGLADHGWIRLLGVGDLKQVQHRLKGYVTGDLASTLNLMPHERREEFDRSYRREEHQTAADEETQASEQSERTHTAGSDLDCAVQELIGAECASGDLSNVTPSYMNLNLILNGKWTTHRTNSQRADDTALHYAQQLSERAVDQVARKVVARRSVARVEAMETRLKREFDNLTGTDAITGFYRWLDKVVSLQVVRRGKRLILEFMLPNPAANYISSMALNNGLPLVKPQPLDAFSAPDGWKQITPCNYQQYALQYRAGTLPPPPETTRLVTQTLQGQPPKSAAEITVPPGYETQAGVVSYLVSGNVHNLVGYVGSETFVIRAPEPDAAWLEASAPALAMAVDNGANDIEKCPAPSRLPPPPIPPPAEGTHAITFASPQQGMIPIAMLNATSTFYANVALTCTLIDPDCGETPDAAADSVPLAVQLWQRQSFDALLDAYHHRLQEYKQALEARIERDSLCREGIIQEEALTQAAYVQLAALLPDAPPLDESPPRFLRFFERAFAWKEMAYRYYPWGTGSRPPETCSWHAECTLDPSSLRLFKAFLSAASARVTVAVTPGYESQVLFYLLYGGGWVGDASSAPITERFIPLISDVAGQGQASAEDPLPMDWTMQVPTDLMIIDKETLLLA